MQEIRHDEHHHDDHDHGHDDAPPIISEKLGRLLAGANILNSIFQIGSSRLNDLGNTADGVHNLGDGIVYQMQVDHLHNHERDEASIQKRRKLSYWLITASSVGIGGKSVYDAAAGSEHEPSKWAEFSSIGSLALAGAVAGYVAPRVWNRVKQSQPLSTNELDFVKHNGTDFASAAGAVSSVYLQKSDLHIPADVISTLTAGISAWAFRPTKKNLLHQHKH